MEAAGAVDAQNAPTAPRKTLRVFHELPQGLSHQIIHGKPRKIPKGPKIALGNPDRPVKLTVPPEHTTMTKKRQKPFDAQALMRLSFLPLTAFAVLLGSCTGSARVHVAQQLCSELSEPDEACWVELTDQTGCNIQLPAPYAAYGDRAETRTWTGMCVEGLGQGTGTLKWGAPVSGNPILWKHTGHLQAGKYHGEWEEDHTFRPSAGYYVGRGSYVEGVRHGQWYEYYGEGFFR